MDSHSNGADETRNDTFISSARRRARKGCTDTGHPRGRQNESQPWDERSDLALRTNGIYSQLVVEYCLCGFRRRGNGLGELQVASPTHVDLCVAIVGITSWARLLGANLVCLEFRIPGFAARNPHDPIKYVVKSDIFGGEKNAPVTSLPSR